MTETAAHRRRLALLAGCVIAAAIGVWALRGRVTRGAEASKQGAAAHPHRGRRAGDRGVGRGRGARLHDSAVDVEVRGTVVDAATGTPVGGGEVVFADARSERTSRADADGHYRLAIKPGTYRAFVRGSGVASLGLAPEERIVAPPRKPEDGLTPFQMAPIVGVAQDGAVVDLQVTVTTVVAGRVANKSGQPVAHALVRATGGAARPVLGTDVAETDEDGAFQLELPSGVVYRLDASHPEYAGLQGSYETLALEAGVRPAPLALTLVAGCVIEGTVMGADGAPATSGNIDHHMAWRDDFTPSGAIARDGTFRWTTVEEGEVTLRAWPWMSPPTAPKKFQCKDGARHHTTLELPGAASDLDGTLVGAGGAPVPGAFLDIIALSPGGVTQQERADEKGDWAVFSMPAGTYLVTATVPGEGFVQRRVTVPSHDVDLVLGGTGSISGTLADATGTLRVELEGCALLGGIRNPVQTQVRLVSMDGDRFHIDGVPACEVPLSVRVGTRTIGQHVAVAARRDAKVSLEFVPTPPVVQPAPIEPPQQAFLPDPPPEEAPAVDEPEPDPVVEAPAEEDDDGPAQG